MRPEELSNKTPISQIWCVNLKASLKNSWTTLVQCQITAFWWVALAFWPSLGLFFTIFTKKDQKFLPEHDIFKSKKPLTKLFRITFWHFYHPKYQNKTHKNTNEKKSLFWCYLDHISTFISWKVFLSFVTLFDKNARIFVC